MIDHLATVALVGRPNVGKSTLFNTLTRSRQAIVSNKAGLTRDRIYARTTLAGVPCMLIDTGGMLNTETAEIDFRVDEQARTAMEEADVIVFVLDARDGLTLDDEQIAAELRRVTKPIVLAVNKIDGVDPDVAVADFYRLGMQPVLTIAAEQRRGIKQLEDLIVSLLPPAPIENANETAAQESIHLAVLGRPNAGKSTLLNRLLGEERLVASPVAGTTRDAIRIPYVDNEGDAFTLIDTAGIRRKARVDDKIEKFSIVKALEAIEQANVVILVLDAQAGITDQDAHLLGEIIKRGRGLVIAVNKWDHLDGETRAKIQAQLERKLNFVDYAEIFYISALHGSNIRALLPAVKTVYRSVMMEISTNQWTQALELAYHRHQPPLVNGRAIKLQYAHQGGKNPPHVIIHGARTDNVPASYTQYLSRFFRQYFHLHGTPIRISYRDKANPFDPEK